MGSEFVLWNLVIVVAWLVTIRICMCSGNRVISRGRRRAALLICFCAYAGMSLPYILTPGHLAHGHPGLHVRLAENNAGIDLCVAMVQYARDHDDRLPRAQSADELAKLLARKGYYTIGSRWWESEQSDPYRIHCPIQMAREPNPETLVFNTEYSGMAQKEFRRRMDEFDQMDPTPSLPLTCVAHPRDDKAKYRAWGDLRLALINSDHSKGKHASQAE